MNRVRLESHLTWYEVWGPIRINSSFGDRGRYGEFVLPSLFGKGGLAAIKEGNWVDGEVRVGYSFGSNDDTAASIVGNGRYHADVTFAPIIYRGQFRGGADAYTLELGAGTVTDGAFFNSNSNFFAGIGYSAQLFGDQGSGDKRKRPALVSTRIGLGSIEIPDVDSDTLRFNSVILDSDDRIHIAPKFRAEKSLSFQAEALFPVRENSYIVIGGRVYDTDPDTWNLHMGLTTDLGGIVEKFAE